MGTKWEGKQVSQLLGQNGPKTPEVSEMQSGRRWDICMTEVGEQREVSEVTVAPPCSRAIPLGVPTDGCSSSSSSSTSFILAHYLASSILR